MVKHKMGFLPKLLIHVVAFSFLLIGIILIHSATNAIIHKSLPVSETYLLFFGTSINVAVVFDLGLLLVSFGFFIEFVFTFRPLYIVAKKRR